jgi:hypothetical protein
VSGAFDAYAAPWYLVGGAGEAYAAAMTPMGVSAECPAADHTGAWPSLLVTLVWAGALPAVTWP